jgi:integrase
MNKNFVPPVIKLVHSIPANFMNFGIAENKGAIATRKCMKVTYASFCRVARKEGWGEVTPLTVTKKNLKRYVAVRIEEGVSAGTIQNEMAHLRRAIRGAKRDDYANNICSNPNLLVPGRSRIGVGLIVDPLILATALGIAPANTRALILLSRHLGLRLKEAVMSGKSLREWERALLWGQPVVVRHGAKNGRMRCVYIRTDNVELALDAVRAALKILETQKYLVQSVSLLAALQQHSARLKRIGLTDINSCHSLRRAFAMDQYEFYLKSGYDVKTALQLTSNDLGHGDGRGRWIYNNYLRASLEKGLRPTVFALHEHLRPKKRGMRLACFESHEHLRAYCTGKQAVPAI